MVWDDLPALYIRIRTPLCIGPGLHELPRKPILGNSVNKDALGRIVGGANGWGRLIRSWQTTAASIASPISGLLWKMSSR
jgi:hypothetical protein